MKRNPKVPGTFACVVKWDKDSKLELVPGRFLWHASDPCLAIFGVEPEKEAKQ